MKFNKANWNNYKRKAKLVELNVKDYDNQTIDFYKIYREKSKDAKRILKKLENDYGFRLDNEKEKKGFLNKDIEWNKN